MIYGEETYRFTFQGNKGSRASLPRESRFGNFSNKKSGHPLFSIIFLALWATKSVEKVWTPTFFFFFFSYIFGHAAARDSSWSKNPLLRRKSLEKVVKSVDTHFFFPHLFGHTVGKNPGHPLFSIIFLAVCRQKTGKKPWTPTIFNYFLATFYEFDIWNIEAIENWVCRAGDSLANSSALGDFRDRQGSLEKEEQKSLDNGKKPPEWWPPKRRAGSLIYLTMGTTGIANFFHKICDLIEKTDLTAVITTGGQVEDLKNVEGVIYLERFISGDLVIEESDLVVCHGGNGTIYQALQHCKPVIGIPTIPDQKFNMRRVESLGVCLTVRWEDFKRNPNALLEAIARVIKTETFSQNALRMKSVLDRYNNGQKEGADLVEQLLLHL